MSAADVLNLDRYRALLRADLASFAEAMLEHTAPEAYRSFHPNWHVRAIAHALTEVAEGRLRRLLILAPPRSLKSHLASVAFPAWMLGHNPTKRILCASHSLDLAQRLARDFRLVVQSPAYRELFPSFRIAGDRDTLTETVTSRRGFRFATSVGGPAVGRGGDIWIFDDLHKPDEVYSDEMRERPYRWFSDTAVTRLDDLASGAIVLAMQRLHPDDIAGRLIETGDWTVLRLPAIADRDIEVPVRPGGSRRFTAGESLQPRRQGPQVLAEQRRSMGPILFAAQYLQAPEDLSGGVVKREWLMTYEPPFEVRPGDRVVQSWDVALSTNEAADYSVCTTWAQRGEAIALIDVIRVQQSLPDLIRTALNAASRWRADDVVIETDGAGLGFFQSLRERIGRLRQGRIPRRSGSKASERHQRGEAWSFDHLGTHAWRVTSSKLERLVAATPWLAEGRVRLPSHAPWLEAYRAELLAFNGAARHDDQVDSTTQALEWMRRASPRIAVSAQAF